MIFAACSRHKNTANSVLQRSEYCLQVAANNKGIGLVQDLIEEYGLPTVQAYMHHIQVLISGLLGATRLSKQALQIVLFSQTAASCYFIFSHAGKRRGCCKADADTILRGARSARGGHCGC